MARKESITKDALLTAAFALLQEEGSLQVTARKLAAKAGCSTQPIFRIYKNMDELYEALFEKACDFFQNYYDSFSRQTVTPFVHLGNIYIRFAAEHKNLVNGRSGNVSREIQSAASQGSRNAQELFMKMWIFIHGAACMSLTGDYDLQEEETIQMLKDSYQAFR